MSWTDGSIAPGTESLVTLASSQALHYGYTDSTGNSIDYSHADVPLGPITPEPASLGLAGVALLVGFGFARRRMRRA